MSITTLNKYKPFPALSDLDPNVSPGWEYGCLLLQAESMDKVGAILLPDSIKDDEAVAATEALIVALSPIAFYHPEWPPEAPPPHQVGDHVVTKRYPAGVKVKGRDGRTYLLCKTSEILGGRPDPMIATEEAKAKPEQKMSGARKAS